MKAALDPAKLARRRFRAREVTAAIQEELDAAKKPTTFTVLSSRRMSNGRGVVVWELSLDQESDKFVLDEGMEGARAWWPEPVKGSAEVLTVNAEDGVISLTGCTCDPPGKDGTLKVYPKPFLEGLRDLWAHPEIGLAAAGWLARGRGGPSLGAPSLDMRPFDAGTARTAQRAAAGLLGHRVGYLWGPPGTGKTTTVGMLLAALLLAPGDARVLLLSTTNAAVDQALEAVDKSLERIARSDHRARVVRLSACHRFGRRFLAEVYRDRGHLLPTPDQELLNQLLEHEAHKPPNDDTIGLVEWSTRRDALRDGIAASRRAVLLSSRLVAMTSTGATFSHETLKEAGPFDWVVFDEGSQVSAAHFAALATLGRRVLVAGDPQQLGPVVLSKGEGPARWLSRSPFDLRDPEATVGMVFLDQQSRMAEGVCELVSNAFYRGKLTLAEDAATDRRWRALRVIHPVASLGSGRLNLVPIAEPGGWSQAWRGFVRPPSAEIIGRICHDLQRAGAGDIVVLTPFRAQRALLRVTLERLGVRGVNVWTVHRAQGSEHHTVIFDPVVGTAKFLLTADARRLINVALSRAQARVILTLSSHDEANPTLRQVAQVMRGEQLPWQRGVTAVEEALRAARELGDLVGTRIIIGDYEGDVAAIDGEQCLLRLADGTTRSFALTAWMKITGWEGRHPGAHRRAGRA